MPHKKPDLHRHCVSHGLLLWLWFWCVDVSCGWYVHLEAIDEHVKQESKGVSVSSCRQGRCGTYY